MISRLLKALLAIFTVLILASIGFIWSIWPDSFPPSVDNREFTDAGRIVKIPVDTVWHIASTADVSSALDYARTHDLKVSIAGKKHSMGGQSIARKGVVLDMLRFNKILAFDSVRQIVTVESGVTWADLQEYLNPMGFACIAMQGPNIFTIGGSISVNAHGWDTRQEQVGQTVVSMRVMLADGSVVTCRSSENPQLFHLIIGGYGLFAVILDADIKVTHNSLLSRHNLEMPYPKLPAFLHDSVLNRPDIQLVFADLSIAPENFLADAVVSTFTGNQSAVSTAPLVEESYVSRDKLFLQLSRKFGWGKALRWRLQNWLLPQGYVTRNNAMRSPYRRLQYYSPHDVDILQEYFVPFDNFTAFVDSLREIVVAEEGNLLNCTIRVVRKDSAAFLNYAKSDDLAFVLYFNVKTDSLGLAQDRRLTSRLIGASESLGGTFYLPYLMYYTDEQLLTAYPEIHTFVALKKNLDPNLVFDNTFLSRIERLD